MPPSPSLRQDLASWDGVSAEAITAIYDRHRGKRAFVGSVLIAMTDPTVETGASWLCKHILEQGRSLSDEQAGRFFRAATGFKSWAARLHALQCMEHAPVPTGSVRDAKKLLDRCLADENKFVRAWAYSGFARLAEAHPRYRAEAEGLLKDAEANETAASVRARVRLVRHRLK